MTDIDPKWVRLALIKRADELESEAAVLLMRSGRLPEESSADDVRRSSLSRGASNKKAMADACRTAATAFSTEEAG